jgi:hypothetical protein
MIIARHLVRFLSDGRETAVAFCQSAAYRVFCNPRPFRNLEQPEPRMLMAAKKIPRQEKKSTLPRKEETTLETLTAHIAGLDAAIAELKTFADEVFRQHKAIGVDGAQKIERARLLVHRRRNRSELAACATVPTPIARAINHGLDAAARAGVIIPHWHPNQLRHASGTQVAQAMGDGASPDLAGTCHARRDGGLRQEDDH